MSIYGNLQFVFKEGGGLHYLQILMCQNLNFKDQQQLFVIVLRRPPKSVQKHPAEKELCGWEEPVKWYRILNSKTQ